jgi:hypothetical protein
MLGQLWGKIHPASPVLAPFDKEAQPAADRCPLKAPEAIAGI